MTIRIFALIAITGAVAACGKAGDLERPAGMTPQPVAYGASEAESAEELIRPDTQAVPSRSSDLLDSNEVREDDPFDVPPGVANVPFPGDPLTEDLDGEGGEQSRDDDDDGA